MRGFNQKLNSIVDILRDGWKSVANRTTEEQLKMVIEQNLKSYERGLFVPDSLSWGLSSNVTKWQVPSTYEKRKQLRSITFGDFQAFCRKFVDRMCIKALIQGNVTESHALDIINKMQNELRFKKIENVSEI